MHKFMKYGTYTVCVNTRSSALQYFERDSWLSRIYQGLLWFCPAQGAEFHPQSILLRDTSKEVRSGHPGVRGLTVGGMHSEQMRRKPEDNPPHGRHLHKPVSGTQRTVALLLPSYHHILWRSSRSNLTTTSSLLCINCRTNQLPTVSVAVIVLWHTTVITPSFLLLPSSQHDRGGGRDDARSRQLKERHKGSHGNHNRKYLADRKRNKGMGPLRYWDTELKLVSCPH